MRKTPSALRNLRKRAWGPIHSFGTFNRLTSRSDRALSDRAFSDRGSLNIWNSRVRYSRLPLECPSWRTPQKFPSVIYHAWSLAFHRWHRLFPNKSAFQTIHDQYLLWRLLKSSLNQKRLLADHGVLIENIGYNMLAPPEYRASTALVQWSRFGLPMIGARPMRNWWACLPCLMPSATLPWLRRPCLKIMKAQAKDSNFYAMLETFQLDIIDSCCCPASSTFWATLDPTYVRPICNCMIKS